MKEVSSFKELISDLKHDVTVLAQTSSYIYHMFDNISWAGFYIVDEDSLYLGPFNGPIACTEIPFSRGVVGACATSKETIVVPNVNLFPGHIACDALSASEIVLPIFNKNKLYAVLDIDSHLLNRFDDEIVTEIKKIALEVSNTISKILN